MMSNALRMYAFVIRVGNCSLLAFGKESFSCWSILIRLSVLCSDLIANMRSRNVFIFALYIVKVVYKHGWYYSIEVLGLALQTSPFSHPCRLQHILYNVPSGSSIMFSISSTGFTPRPPAIPPYHQRLAIARSLHFRWNLALLFHSENINLAAV